MADFTSLAYGRTAVRRVLAASAMLFLASSVQTTAQDLTLIAPAGPGSGYDQVARSVETALKAEKLSTNVQVLNVTGGTGLVALGQFVSKNSADPNTVLVSGFGMVSSSQLNKAAVTLKDITPAVRLMGEYQAFAVAASSEIRTAADLVAAVQTESGKVVFAGGGVGSSDHIAAGMFFNAIGIAPGRMNFVAFTGGGEVTAAVLGGHVTVGVSGTAEFDALVKSGDLRIIGVTSKERLKGIDAPTFAEQGVNFEFQNWRMVAIGNQLPEAEREVLLATLRKVGQSPSWEKEVEARGWQNTYLDGDALNGFIDEQLTTVGKTLQDLGLVK